MLGYRLYLYRQDGHIDQAIELALSTDEEAVQAAQQYRDGMDMELWTGSRMVARIPKLAAGAETGHQQPIVFKALKPGGSDTP